MINQTHKAILTYVAVIAILAFSFGGLFTIIALFDSSTVTLPLIAFIGGGVTLYGIHKFLTRP